MTDDKMIGWHHQLNGHEFEQAPGVGDGQGGLWCCDSWGRKEEQLKAVNGGLCQDKGPVIETCPDCGQQVEGEYIETTPGASST